jgi:two-component system sensor histidine kinase MprB
MNLRVRLALTAGLMLAGTVTVVSVGAYVTTEREVRREVDASLQTRADSLWIILNRLQRPPSRPSVFPPGAPREQVTLVIPENAGNVQLLDEDGNAAGAAPDGFSLPIDANERRLAEQGGRPYVHTVESDGTRFRVRTVPLRFGGALQVARDIEPTEQTLAALRRRYAIGSLLIFVFGAAIGWLLAKWLTRPIERLTAAAEHVATTGQPDAVIDSDIDAGHRGDEVGRLSKAFASMLAALRESRERQRQLVQDASHELRTPVTAIRTNVDVLRRHPYLDSTERAKVLDDVNAELTQVTAMVGELVELASGDGEGDHPHVPVRVDEVVKEAADLARRRTSRPINVTVEPFTVIGSAKALDRAVSNLIDNAVKFSPTGSAVDVDLHNGRLTVRDHGPGIPEHDLPHVFDRFYRATTARTEPGSGLGLAIVDQVVRSHGGRTFAQNSADGGAIVGFDLEP